MKQPENAEKKGVSSFLLVTFSHGLLHIFQSSLAPILPLIRVEFSLSYTAVGVLTLIVSLCWALSGVPAGIIADRVDRTRVVLFTFILAGVFSSIMILTSTFLGLALILIFLFLSIGLYHPPVYSYLTDRYSGQRGKIFGVFETGGSVGILLAPLAAGLISSYLGWRYAYTLWALPAFAVSALFYGFARKGKLQDKGKFAENQKEESPDAGEEEVSHFYPRLRRIYLAHGFFGAIVGGTVAFLPLFLTDMHSFSVSSAGGMLTLFLTGGLAGKLIGGKYSDTWGPRKVIILGFIGTSFFLLLIALLPGLLLIPVLLVAGAAFFMILPPLFLLTGEVKTTDLGLAYGIQLLSGSGSGALSKFFSGLVSDIFGIQYLFFLLSSVSLFAAVFTYFSLERKISQ